MPLSNERDILLRMGLDPESYTIDPLTTQIVSKASAQPNPSTSTATVAQPSPTGDTSALGAFGRSAAQSVIPTGGGIVGGMLGGAAAGTLGAGPIGTVIGGLIGAGLGGFGANKLQEAVVPQDIQEQLFSRPEDLQQHPVASFAGGLAPNAIAFNPLRSIQQLPTLASGIGKSVANVGTGAKVLSAAEQAAMQNAAINVGGGAGIDIAQQLASGQPYDPLETIKNAAAGLLFSEPTAIGKRLGFHGVADAQNQQAQLAGEVAQRIKAIQADRRLSEVQKQAFIDELTGQQQRQTASQSESLRYGEEQSKQFDAVEAQRQLEEQQARNAQAQRDAMLNTLYGTHDATGRPYGDSPNQAFNQVVPEPGLRPIPATESRLTGQTEITETQPSKSAAESAANILSIESQRNARYELEQRQAIEAERRREQFAAEQKALETELENKIHEAQKANLEGQIVALEEQQRTVKRDIETRYQKQANNIATDTTITPEQKKNLLQQTRELAAKRGVKLELPEVVMHATEPTTAVAGKYDPTIRTASVSKTAGGIDTGPHEVAGHASVIDLLHSTNPKDVRTALDGLEYVSGKKLKSKAEWDALPAEERIMHEEGLAKLLGEESLARQKERALQGSGVKYKFRRWYEDVKANLVSKDSVKKLASRAERDLPFTEDVEKMRGFLGNKNDTPSEVKYQTQSDKESLSTEADTPKPKNLFYRVLGSQTNKVKNLGTEEAEHVARKATEFFDKASLMTGKLAEVPKAMAARYSKQEREHVRQYMSDMAINETSDVTLTPREEQLVEALKEHQVMVADINKAREIEKKPNYYMGNAMIDRNVVSEWANNPYSPKSRYYSNRWMEHAQAMREKGKHNYSDEELKKLLSDYKDAVASHTEEPTIMFGALRKAEGIGLPQELQEKNLLAVIDRYGRRAARDIAHYDTLESDPAASYLLRLRNNEGQRIQQEPAALPSGKIPTEDLLQSKDVQKLMKMVYNDYPETKSPWWKAASRLSSNMILGTGTGVRDLVSSPLNASHVVTSGSRGVAGLSSLAVSPAKLQEAWKTSLEYGSRTKNVNDLEFGAASSPDKIVATMNEMADVFRKYSGRQLFDEWGKAYSFAVAKDAARAELGNAIKGNRKALEFLKQFDTTLEGYKNIDELIASNEPISDENLNRIAKNMTDRMVGSYNATGLPYEMMTGPMHNYLSIMKWSVEKANRIYEDVYKQAKGGNFVPLLTYTLGAYFTGEGIKELNQLLNNRKAQDATWKEASAAGNKTEQARALAITMQYAGYGGVIADILKASADVASGRAPKSLIFPLGDFVANGLTHNIASLSAALEAGEDPWESLLGFTRDVATDSVQSVRLMANHTWKAKDLERADKTRDYRVYQELVGIRDPAVARTAAPNRLANKDLNTFKHTDDLSEAVDLLPKLIAGAVDKADGDYERLKAALRNIKATQYPTMPDPTRNPAAAIKYLAWIEQTQGGDAVSRVVEDYMRQKTVNKVKSQMVPSV